MKKLVKVHRLPTEDKTDTLLVTMGKLTELRCIPLLIKEGLSPEDYKIKSYQHLYFTSSEEIKEGDWVYCDNGNITQITPSFWSFKGKSIYRKIVATNDKSLRTKESCVQCGGTGETTFSGTYNTQRVCDVCQGRKYTTTKLLPQISQSFIEEYVKAGGIDEVFLEYEELFKYYPKTKVGYQLKTDSNNYVITHLVEPKLYTREEFKTLLIKALNHEGYKTEFGRTKDNANWIKENLK